MHGPSGLPARKRSLRTGSSHKHNGIAVRIQSTIFFLYDANCNVNAIVDEEGELVRTFDYDEFGALRTGITPYGDNHLQFAGGVGHPTDDSGLVYMRARYYDPASGRFISEDPGRNGLNWYVYCGNNPVNAIDSTGQETEFYWDAFFAGLEEWNPLFMGESPYLRSLLEYSCGGVAIDQVWVDKLAENLDTPARNLLQAMTLGEVLGIMPGSSSGFMAYAEAWALYTFYLEVLLVSCDIAAAEGY